MEFPRFRPRSRSLLIAAAVALVVVIAGAMLLRDRPPPPDLIEGHAFAVPPMEGRIEIEVLNATHRDGLARNVTRKLRRAGLDVVFFANADSEWNNSAVVVRRGDPAHGDTVARVLGINRVVVRTDTLRRVDVSVFLGKDFKGQFLLHP